MQRNFKESGELKEGKIEPEIVAEFYTPEGKRRQIIRSVALSMEPDSRDEQHRFEITYEEIRPGVWQKVPGSEKDFGIV